MTLAADELQRQKSGPGYQQSHGTRFRNVADELVLQTWQNARRIKAGHAWSGEIESAIVPFGADFVQDNGIYRRRQLWHVGRIRVSSPGSKSEKKYSPPCPSKRIKSEI